MTDTKLTKESLGEALCADKHPQATEAFKKKYGVGYHVYIKEAARRLYEPWDELEALDKAGDEATQGDVWLKGENSQHVSSFNRLRGNGLKPNGGIADFKHDRDAIFTVVAANLRPAIKVMIKGDE